MQAFLPQLLPGKQLVKVRLVLSQYQDDFVEKRSTLCPAVTCELLQERYEWQ